ncbi:hypothetical protein ACTWP5_03395 [Streptomyces sp. 4N509B]|uniref:hypothetical protein n=1 Tax=Streptomyces sp. 4N509B TaxID=3457413 RepID=UPI003FD68B88
MQQPDQPEQHEPEAGPLSEPRGQAQGQGGAEQAEGQPSLRDRVREANHESEVAAQLRDGRRG